MSCDEPVALFSPMCESIIVRVSFGSCGHVCFPCEVNFIVGCSIRVRCRHKKFTFAISSPDEFLFCNSSQNNLILDPRQRETDVV